MRLICGILQLDGREPDGDRLGRMLEALDPSRIQPCSSVWRGGPVALAVLDFRRSPGGSETLPDEDRAVIAADVRLDDPAGLRREAGAPADAADDVVLRHLIVRFGPAALDRVLGDFAFAYWDSRSQALTLGRDGFGVRPLAYTHRPGELFAFASLPLALHGAGFVPKIVDEEALARRAARRFCLDDSFVVGVRRLAPAHALTVTADGILLRRYWKLDRGKLGTRRCTPEDAARELGRLVDQAVACRLPKGEIGAHLSGGLDSSALAVLAARRLKEQGRALHAYSFLDRQRNDVALEDETEFVQAVIEQEAGIDWTPVQLPTDFAAAQALDIDKMQPLDPEQPEEAVGAVARSQGVGLILSGWGGDEAATFNGRGVLAEHFLRGRWRLLQLEMAALSRTRGWSLPEIFRQQVVAFLLPRQAVDLAKRLAGWRPEEDLMLTGEARRRAAASGVKRAHVRAIASENRWRLINGPHIAERAEIWAASGARHGVAYAFPLLDRRVVEFALSLPSGMFLSGGFRRRLFRDAMAGVLPDKVRLRHAKYQPFPGAILDMARRKDEILEEIEAYSRIESVRRVVDIERLRRQVKALPEPEELIARLPHDQALAGAAQPGTVLRALRLAQYLAQHGAA